MRTRRRGDCQTSPHDRPSNKEQGVSRAYYAFDGVEEVGDSESGKPRPIEPGFWEKGYDPARMRRVTGGHMSCVGALSFGKKLDLRCINIIRTLAMDRSLLYMTGWARISTAMDTSWLTIPSQPGDRHRRR